MRNRLVTIAICSLVVLVVMIAAVRASRLASAGSVADRVSATITIDSRIGEKFAPPPSFVTPALDPETAWAAYAKLNGSSVTTVPNDVTVELGLLTLPVGPVGPGDSYCTRPRTSSPMGTARSHVRFRCAPRFRRMRLASNGSSWMPTPASR